jgi:hypothetical protein
VPSAFSPVLFGQVSSGGAVQAPSEVFDSQSVKFAVVPESSERCTAVIAVSGRSTPSFRAAIAGSFHVVISPWKILAIVGESSWSSSTPLTLKMTAIGLT